MSHVFPTETHLRTWNPEGDAFGRQELAKKVVENILTKMETPNVLGIYGDWGMGKTTFLHYLQMVITGKRKNDKDEELDIDDGELKNFRASLKREDSERGDLDKIAIVHFEPWKYEYARDADLLFALLDCINEKLDVKNESWKDVGSAVVDISRDVLKEIAYSFFRNKIGVDFAEVFQKLGMGIDKARIEKFGEFLPEYEAWFSHFDNLQKLFGTFINTGLAKQQKERIIIFIDDLDRCLPENTIKLLEAIKNFLFQDKVIFVLAIDQCIVSEMIQKKYGLSSGYGLNYLEKIVSIYVPLSRPSLAQVIHDVFLTCGFGSINPEVEAHIVSFIESHLPEPRRAKMMTRQVLLNSIIKLHDLSDFTDIQYAFLAEYLVRTWPAIFRGSTQEVLDILETFHQSTKKKNNGHLSEASDVMRGNTLVPLEERQAISNVLSWQTLDLNRDPANNKASLDRNRIIHILTLFGYIK